VPRRRTVNGRNNIYWYVSINKFLSKI
jgi:hypothetical protein